MLHGHVDNLETSCFVFTLFQFLFQNEGPFLHDQNELLSSETFEKVHSLPTIREKLNLTPPFLRAPMNSNFIQNLQVNSPQCLPHPVPWVILLCGWVGWTHG